MVDRSAEFQDISRDATYLSDSKSLGIGSSTINHSSTKKEAGRINDDRDDFSAITRRTIDMLVSFENLVHSIVEEYVGYHRFLPTDIASHVKIFTEAERSEFDQELALFIAMFASEINVVRLALEDSQGQIARHYLEMCNYLFNRLGSLSKISQNLRREFHQYNFNSFQLSACCSNIPTNNIGTLRSTNSASIKNKKVSLDSSTKDIKSNIGAGSRSSSSSSSSIDNNRATETLISDRYDGEIASVSKMKQYKEVGDSYKSLLMKEAKDLSGQFSEDLIAARKVEGSVEQISALLGEFVRIVQSQSDRVESIYDAGEAATDSVKQTDNEMQLTIERSKSFQWNMVFLSTFLAVLLLVLDWITP